LEVARKQRQARRAFEKDRLIPAPATDHPAIGHGASGLMRFGRNVWIVGQSGGTTGKRYPVAQGLSLDYVEE
jgi:hypothetical protein